MLLERFKRIFRLKTENELIRKVAIDETISYENRILLLSNYLPSLITRERLELERVKKESENNKQ